MLPELALSFPLFFDFIIVVDSSNVDLSSELCITHMLQNVTGFVKIDPNHKRTESHFIVEH